LDTVFRFARVEVRPVQRQVLVAGQPASLGARAFDVLLHLIERRGQLVTKHELLDAVWSGLVVEENNLSVHISALRRLLGAETIVTIPGRGYRFAASLESDVPVAAHPDPAGRPDSHALQGGALTNLPRQLPPLYGRSDDVAAVRAELRRSRLVTLVGAGGIGKSRLAQAVAHESLGQWPDGVWLVELAGLADPSRVPHAVAQALDARLAGSGMPQDDLTSSLARQSLLVVLDNCEHLLDAISELAHALLRTAPGLTLLATSQEPLRLADEQQFRVAPLAVPADAAPPARDFGAVALFEARVHAVDPRLAIGDNDLPLVVEICRRLDGLPLAIELAAARVPKLGLRGVRDKLDERFKLLTGGARIALRRHQTLRAALEWSHQLITAEEQVVFRRLGVFAGGFTMELAQAVTAEDAIDAWAALDHLGTLVDKSLVVVDVGESPRYRLLESARAYALEQLAAAGETAAALKRHAAAVGDLLAAVDEAWLDGELRSDELAARLAPEIDNLRAAHDWASGEAGDSQLAIALAARSSAVIGFASECVRWLHAHRPEVERGVDPALAARFWLALASVAMRLVVPKPMQRDAARSALEGFRALGQARRIFLSLQALARAELRTDNIAASEAAIEEMGRIVDPHWPVLLYERLVRMQGWMAERRGDFAQATALHRESVSLTIRSGDWRAELTARCNLADLLWGMGALDEASREIQALREDMRSRFVTAAEDRVFVLGNAIGIFGEQRRLEEAADAAREALDFIRGTQEPALDPLTHLFWQRGQMEAAARLLGASDAFVAGQGAPRQKSEARLIARARPALRATLGDEAFERCIRDGSALGLADIHALIAAALAEPPRAVT
jgi:predicted ATPase/DNA-binding winged helix-turn-helix (wHTH) protein